MADNMAQGPAKPATAADIIKDNSGITKPNLHRRIDNDLTVVLSGGGAEVCNLVTELGEVIAVDENYVLAVEVSSDMEVPATYALSVGGVNSFRHADYKVHNEDSTTTEVP